MSQGSSGLVVSTILEIYLSPLRGKATFHKLKMSAKFQLLNTQMTYLID